MVYAYSKPEMSTPTTSTSSEEMVKDISIGIIAGIYLLIKENIITAVSAGFVMVFSYLVLLFKKSISRCFKRTFSHQQQPQQLQQPQQPQQIQLILMNANSL